MAQSASPSGTPFALHGPGALRLSWPVLAALAAYAFCWLRREQVLVDGDTFWHIAAGQWILRHGRVPDQDPFSWTLPGAPWTAHEWLSEVLLAAAHAAAGWPGVVGLTACAFALAVALLARALLRQLEPIYVLLFAAFAIVLSASHLLARPHVLAMPLMVLWTAGLVQARDEDRAPPLLLLPAMTLWANLHGGFTLGLALAAAVGLEAIVQAARGSRWASARAWGLFLALATLSALLTPHGIRGIAFTWELFTQNSLALERVAEWRPASFHKFGALEIWLLGGLAAALYQGIRIPPLRLLMLLGFLHLALRHVRYIELLGLLVPLLLAAPLAAHGRRARASGSEPERLDRWFTRVAQPAGRAAVAATAALFLLLPFWVARVSSLEPPAAATPRQAVQAAREAGLHGQRLFNDYSWGGYLIHEGLPPFIDGRADMYGDAFFREYAAAAQPKSWAALREVLDRHRIAWTLLPLESPAAALLDLAPGWTRQHADEVAVIHVRTPRTPAGETAAR